MTIKRNGFRCWVTAVEMSPNDAWVLDRKAVNRVRRELTEKLAMIDHLLDDLGAPAGDSPRCVQLGLPPYARRLVSTQIAEMYNQKFGGEDYFVRWNKHRSDHFHEWVRDIRRDPNLGPKFENLNEETWRRLYTVSAFFVSGISPNRRSQVTRMGLSACVALVCPEIAGRSRTAFEGWLLRQTPEEIADLVRVPGMNRNMAVEILEERRDAARERWIGSLRSKEPESLDSVDHSNKEND